MTNEDPHVDDPRKEGNLFQALKSTPRSFQSVNVFHEVFFPFP